MFVSYRYWTWTPRRYFQLSMVLTGLSKRHIWLASGLIGVICFYVLVTLHSRVPDYDYTAYPQHDSIQRQIEECSEYFQKIYNSHALIHFSTPMANITVKEDNPDKFNCTGKLENGVISLRVIRNRVRVTLSANEIRHVGFLKVHKAGSSTMQNIFLRFAMYRNLTVVLPNNSNYFSSSALTHNELLPVPEGEHYDILACHSIFSQKTYSEVLPGDSVYIGIIRDPLQQMVSAAYYYRDVFFEPYLKKIGNSNFIHNLIRYPNKHEQGLFSKTRNSMSSDFGFQQDMIGNKEKISRYLSYLNDSFSLVLVVERFDESLIMMKRLLHWKLFDILYLINNRHDHKPVYVSQADAKLFAQRNSLDYDLYNFFAKELERKISLQGPDFKDEVKHFNRAVFHVSKFCQSEDARIKNIRFKPTAFNEAFTVTREHCRMMGMAELDFLEVHRKLRMTKLRY